MRMLMLSFKQYKWLRLFGQRMAFYKWSLATIPIKPHRADTPDNRSKPHPGLIRQALSVACDDCKMSGSVPTPFLLH